MASWRSRSKSSPNQTPGSVQRQERSLRPAFVHRLDGSGRRVLLKRLPALALRSATRLIQRGEPKWWCRSRIRLAAGAGPPDRCEPCDARNGNGCRRCRQSGQQSPAGKGWRIAHRALLRQISRFVARPLSTNNQSRHVSDRCSRACAPRCTSVRTNGCCSARYWANSRFQSRTARRTPSTGVRRGSAPASFPAPPSSTKRSWMVDDGVAIRNQVGALPKLPMAGNEDRVLVGERQRPVVVVDEVLDRAALRHVNRRVVVGPASPKAHTLDFGEVHRQVAIGVRRLSTARTSRPRR